VVDGVTLARNGLRHNVGVVSGTKVYELKESSPTTSLDEGRGAGIA